MSEVGREAFHSVKIIEYPDTGKCPTASQVAALRYAGDLLDGALFV